MKRRHIIGIVVIVLILIILFFPKSIDNAVVIKTDKTTTLFVKGEVTKFTFKESLPNNSVVSFNYNVFFTYNVKKQVPITDRVMTKINNSYDFETLGNKNISKNALYYKIDKNNNITKATSKDLILGISNLNSYKGLDGSIDTILISPIDYSQMRVGITNTDFTSIYHKSVKIMLTSDTQLYSKREKLDSKLTAGSILTFDISGEKMKLTINGESKFYKDRIYLKGSGMLLESIERGNQSFTPTYNGVMEITLTKGGFQIVNEVPLEEYLYSVVPSEMPSSSGIEALKSQAIAARTYAVADMKANRFEKLGFFVDDSTESQVFNNIAIKSSTTSAVNATKDMIMTYKGAPIDAKYYSTSCGYGASYSDIFFNGNNASDSRPYLVGNNFLIPANFASPKSEADWLAFYKSSSISGIDKSSPYFRWNIEFSVNGLTNSLNKSIKELYKSHSEFIKLSKDGKPLTQLPDKLQTLQDVKVVKRGNNGNAKEISFIFSNITINISSDYIIRSTLKSSVDYLGAGEQAVTNIANNRALNNSSILLSSFFSIEKGSGKYKFYGGGFGHGVGMSQYGAIQLSSIGFKYQDILKTYYKDITIDTLN